MGSGLPNCGILLTVYHTSVGCLTGLVLVAAIAIGEQRHDLDLTYEAYD